MTPPDTSGDMWLTLREAAEAFDVSLSTLHRRKRSGELEDVGAFKDGDTWKIPRQGLARLGFKELVPPVSPGQVTLEEALSESEADTVPVTPPVTPAGIPRDTPRDTPDTAEIDRLREQLEEAQRQTEEAERRAAIAEAVAAERDRIIKAQENALRLLEPAAADRTPPPSPAEPQSAPEPPQPQRKGWWRRMWG